MSTELKKKILIAAELISSEVGVFFQELGFELESSFVPGAPYSFAIDSVCPEVKNIPRIQMSESVDSGLAPMVCGKFNKEMFTSEQGRKLLSSYFHDALEFDLVDRYSKEMSNIYSIKIHEFLNLGYFVDSIVIEAYKAKFDIAALRSYLNEALSFAFNKVEKNSTTMPVDVSYSHNGEAFVISISLSCDQWKGADELGVALSELTAVTNYFDATYFHKTSRLTLSSLMFKNADLKSAKANFFTEVVRRSAETEKNISSLADIYTGLVFNEPVRYQGPKQVITDPATKLVIARKFAHFIKDYRHRIEDPQIPLGKLVADDVVSYLGHYPKQEEIQDVDSEVKNFIFKLLTNQDFSNDVDDFVQVVMDSYPNAVVREIQKIMGDKGLEDMESIIASQPLKNEDGFITRVKGGAHANEQSDIQRVSGSGNGEMSDNDLWELRKSQLNMKEHAPDHVRIKSTPSSKEVHNNNEIWEVQSLANPISEEAQLNKEKLEAEFSQKLLNQQASPDAVKEKLESQMDRIKKIMYQLKKEIVKLQAEKIAREEADLHKKTVEDPDMARMKSSMERSMEAIKSKDLAIEKMKKDFDQFIRNKDQKIEILEQRIASMRYDSTSPTDEAGNSGKLMMEKLEHENKSLQFKLELANKKMTIATERMGQREIDINAKRERDIETIKGNLKLAQSIIDEMKIEKAKLESRANEDREALKKLREEGASKKNDEDKESIIQVLSAERRSLEEKFKLQAIELKKLEQKLKYSASQLEASNKKKAGANPNLKSPEHYAKQLEQTSARMAEATAEVIEKRREIVKVKQENSMMAAKITELEKKLANLDKKVA